MFKWITLISLLAASAVCYLAGSVAGTVGFIIAGVVLELLFYFEVFNFIKSKKGKS